LQVDTRGNRLLATGSISCRRLPAVAHQALRRSCNELDTGAPPGRHGLLAVADARGSDSLASMGASVRTVAPQASAKRFSDQPTLGGGHLTAASRKCVKLLAFPPAPVGLYIFRPDFEAIFGECLEDIIRLHATLDHAFLLQLERNIVRKVEADACEGRFRRQSWRSGRRTSPFPC
jgi:hypothetical protein